MKILMKIIIRLAFVVALLLTGFAAGFPIGQSVGFETGSEWAMMQADLIAREAGLVMPISFEEGQFHIVVKQPPYLHKRAWRLADQHDEAMMQASRGDETLSARVQLARDMYLTQ